MLLLKGHVYNLAKCHYGGDWNDIRVYILVKVGVNRSHSAQENKSLKDLGWP